MATINNQRGVVVHSGAYLTGVASGPSGWGGELSRTGYTNIPFYTTLGGGFSGQEIRSLEINGQCLYIDIYSERKYLGTHYRLLGALGYKRLWSSLPFLPRSIYIVNRY